MKAVTALTRRVLFNHPYTPSAQCGAERLVTYWESLDRAAPNNSPVSLRNLSGAPSSAAGMPSGLATLAAAHLGYIEAVHRKRRTVGT